MTNSTQRRRRTSLLIGMIGLATAATVGLTACGSSNGSTSATHGPDGSSAEHGPRNPGGRGNGVAGTISAENGDNWTITKRDGSTETVAITPATVFGSTQHPIDRSSFAVGQTVMVQGETSGTTVTATRIGQARNRSGSSSAAPSSAPAPTS